MGLFSSIGHKHLDGHKELTKHSEIISLLHGEYMPTKVYFPTMSGNGKPITALVNPGDQVKVGTKIAERTDFGVPVYSSVSGTVLANEMVFSPIIGRPIAHITIENDGKYEQAEPLKTVKLSDSKEDIINAIKLAGLEGMGGAGFPTAVKYGNTQAEVILVNGVECEPYLTTDFVAMIQNAKELVLGCQYLMKAAGAKKAIVALKVHKEEARDALRAAAAEYDNVEVVEVPDLYPMGWERTLVKQVLKKTYERLPIEAGAVVNNAQTVISLGIALSTGRVVANRLVTVSGDGINNPHNVLCPIGTKADLLIGACGGYVDGDINLIPGGPMCGKAVRDDKFVVGLPTGSLTVLRFVERTPEACLRCGRCTQHCPSNLQPVEIKNAYDRKDFDRVGDLCILDCVECGMCSFICPSKIELTDTMRKAKMMYKLKKK